MMTPKEVRKARMESIRKAQDDLNKVLEKLEKLNEPDDQTDEAFRQLAGKRAFALYNKVIEL